jgi:hypothetical protein
LRQRSFSFLGYCAAIPKLSVSVTTSGTSTSTCRVRDLE